MLSAYIYRVAVLAAGFGVLGALAPEIRAQNPRSPSRRASPQQPAPAALPPVRPANGPLAINIEYPAPHQRITAIDSTFLFGSVGNGSATLTVNGLVVRVAPNGAFLAWVPIPADSAPVFRFVARLGGD